MVVGLLSLGSQCECFNEQGEAVSPFMNQPRKPSSIISTIVYGLNKPTQTQGEIKNSISEWKSIKKAGRGDGGQFLKPVLLAKKKKKT